MIFLTIQRNGENMMRQFKIVLLVLVGVLSFTTVASENVSAAPEQAWVLVERYEFPIRDEFYNAAPWSYHVSIEGNMMEAKKSIPYNIYRDPPPTVLHAKYYWQNVPEVIKANETVTLQLKQEVIENTHGGYYIGILPNFYLDAADLDLGFSTAWRVNSTGVYEDGQATKWPGIGYDQDVQAQSDYTATFSLQAKEEGMIGDQFALFTTLYVGGPGSIGVKYIYEWQEIENDVERERYNVSVFHKWKITFSDVATNENVKDITIEKDEKAISRVVVFNNTNQVTVTPADGVYERNSRYLLKIELTNGKKYSMYFNTEK